MYVKEDLVLPHNLSFYDLIISNARGKSGPLFHFDVYDDVRLEHNANVEKEESHAGKACSLYANFDCTHHVRSLVSKRSAFGAADFIHIDTQLLHVLFSKSCKPSSV